MVFRATSVRIQLDHPEPPCGPAGVHDDSDVCGPGRDGLHLGALADLLAPRDDVPEGHDLGVAGEAGHRRRLGLKQSDCDHRTHSSILTK